VNAHAAYLDPWTREMVDLRDAVTAAVFELRAELARLDRANCPLSPADAETVRRGLHRAVDELDELDARISRRLARP